MRQTAVKAQGIEWDKVFVPDMKSILPERKKIEVRRDGGFWHGMPQPITVQIGYFEDGDFFLEECNHAGAEEEESIGYTFWEDAGGCIPDGSGPIVLVCDKENCKAESVDGRIWGK